MGNARQRAGRPSSREWLLEAARTLFYEQGYTATTLAQISRKSGVNNGLITYYFGTKNSLAREIYNLYLTDLRNYISRQLFLGTKAYTMAMNVAVETRIMLSQKFENPNFLRFFIEYRRDNAPFVNPYGRRERWYQLQRDMINPALSDIDLKLYSVCGIAVVERLTEAYHAGYLDCDIDYLEDYAVRALFSMLRMPEAEAEQILEQSRRWERELYVRVTDGFRLEEREPSC